MGTKQIDLTGMQFGKLTAIVRLNSKEYNGSKKRVWLCICTCGTLTEVTTGQLKKGSTQSCGCLKLKSNAENSRKSRHKIVKEEAGFNVVLGRYKTNAKSRGLDFCLSVDSVKTLLHSDCYYCGLPPSNVYDKSYYNFVYSGIDRKDNTRGYFEDNCVACCSTCNHAKATMSEDNFYAWIKRLMKYQRGE